MRHSPKSITVVLVLGALAAISPFATDMYTPALPTMVSAFATTSGAVQLSLTTCLLGIALGQLVIGPLSDAVGRRRPLLVGTLSFAVLSLGCAAAPTVELFDIARFLQGVAGSCGLVLGRAIIGDRFAGSAAARKLSLLSAVTMTAPIIAPIAGGLVLTSGSWRMIFVVLALLGALAFLATWTWVPETGVAAQGKSVRFAAVGRAMLGLARSRVFVGNLVVMGTAVGALFAYITSAPFVFQGEFSLSANDYGVVFATNACGTVVASVLFGRCAARMRVSTLLVVGVAIACAAMVSLCMFAAVGAASLAVTWVCFCCLTTAFGLLLSASVTIILTLGRAASGAASGMLGAAQFVLGALAAPLSSAFGDVSVTSTALVVASWMLLCALVLGLLGRPWRVMTPMRLTEEVPAGSR